ncbi:NAD-dependent epimerase/dehydratase family protein [Tengunoibacter tsumagoiensis]|uniref:Putative UDP-glucose epimerase YtcB n=1 Tax=Tengunoibacter tsumagoiensis TaxID=2014871 RepID=A0A401ZVH0_9CHLR|nr:NAD-dependent epimerase/dehydratase family protein [Tengunoibacter tsumagoiensis]GCE10905.1 putative UDP-glucose epimerase YtcB [Tengunoibacter tsumagoiensis]
MRCLVTGVAGFVGSHLAERLLADGHEVCGVDGFIDYYPRYMKERNLEGPRSWDRFTLIEGNLLTLSLTSLVEGVDWIFHQAAQAGVRASWGDEFGLYVDCNVLSTQRLLDAVLQTGNRVKRFVYASSSSVYGDTPILPVTEATATHPVSPYGVTKLAAEHLCSLYYQNFGVPTVSLRYFTVYGPRQRPDMAFHKFCKSLAEDTPIRVFDDGQQTRDFTYIADVVEANVRSATTATPGAVMNIAGGSRVTVRHVIDLLQEVSGLTAHVSYEQKQHGDVRDTFADIGCASQLMGYQPRFSLREGLANEFESIVALYGYKQRSIA